MRFDIFQGNDSCTLYTIIYIHENYDLRKHKISLF